MSVSVTTGDPAFENQGQYFATAATLLLYQNHDATPLTGALLQVADSGVDPVQTNTAAPDGTRYGFKVTSHHSLVTRGYLDTPHGRAVSNVVQDVRFSNDQHVISTDTRFDQAIAQTSTALQRSYVRPLAGPRNTTTNWSFPLSMDINVLFPSDGSFSQATTVDQGFSLRYRETGGPDGHYAFDRNQSDSAADTLNFDSDGNFTGPTGQRATQTYTFTDSNGAYYSRTVEAVAGAVTSVTDDAACTPQGRHRH